jgi:DNA-3-methyladenine glycosylase II
MNKRTKIIIDKKLLRPITLTKNPFLSLAGSIVSQQISTSAARSIYKRFLALFGRWKPTPELLLELSDENLRGAGLSASKVKYMRDLAVKFIDKTINPKQFASMGDEEIIEHLTKVKGIGVWTAHMFLMFALNRPNVLPVGDLAIKKAFQKVCNLKKLPTEKEMIKLAEEHKGNWTELSLYLWEMVDPVLK